MTPKMRILQVPGRNAPTTIVFHLMINSVTTGKVKKLFLEEAASLRWSIRKLRKYLRGSEFTVL